MRYSITLQMTEQEWKIFEAALTEIVRDREEQSRFVREDCRCGAAELKHEAEVLKYFKQDAAKQIYQALRRI